MGFFDRLFSSEPELTEEEKNRPLRAQYKDHVYFKKELQRVNEWIAKDKENHKNYLKTHENLRPAHYSGIYSTQEKKIGIMYSDGFPINDIRDEYQEAIPNFLKGWKAIGTSYVRFLNALTLSTLLYLPKNVFKEIAERLQQSEKHPKNESVPPDALLRFLLNFHLEEPWSITDNVAYSEYKPLVNITKLDKKEASIAMKSYLEQWYDLNKESPWHGNHTREWRYSGYWAWEAAAVTKIMGLDDSFFKDNPYYPSDMVHWRPSGQ